jgi:1,4-dihydroxy-2-naphthoate octaprenyltransferase
LLLLGLGIAGIPLLAASAGRPIEGGYKLLGDATSGVLFGGILVIAAVVFFVQALRIALRNRRR